MVAVGFEPPTKDYIPLLYHWATAMVKMKPYMRNYGHVVERHFRF